MLSLPLVPIAGLLTRNAVAFHCQPDHDSGCLVCGLVLVNEGIFNGEVRLFADAVTGERHTLRFHLDSSEDVLMPNRGYQHIKLIPVETNT